MKWNIVNYKFVSDILTNVLLYKNLKHHYQVKNAVKKGRLLNNCKSPYQYLKQLLFDNPSVMNTVAIMQDRDITYNDFWNEINDFSKYLYFLADGKRYENISICAASSIEGLVAFFAMNKIGIVNARIFNGSQAEKLKYNILNFESKIVLTDEKNISELSKIIDETKVTTVVILSGCETKKINDFIKKHPSIKLITYKDAIEEGRKIDDDYEADIASEDLASILYTSGSSGEPKPISMPNRVYTNMVDVVCVTTNIVKCDGERVIGVVSHEYPYAAINSTVMILLMGKSLIMPKHKMDNLIDFDELMKTKPHRIQAIPNFYKLLQQAGESGSMKINEFSSLNSVISGGERYLKSEKNELLDFLSTRKSKPMLIDGFGFGELGSATALKFGMCDYFLLMNGIEAKSVHPETMSDLPLDEEGILCFTGPTIAEGYYNNDEANKKSFIKDNNGKKWFVSDTYGLVHGKKKRLIKLGGRIREYFITGDGEGNFVKVYAGTVEDVILACPYVTNCIVVPSDGSGNPSPVAYISLTDEGMSNKEKVIDDIRTKCLSLEKFAQPTLYEVENDIARTDAGKKDYSHYKKLRGIVLENNNISLDK